MQPCHAVHGIARRNRKMCHLHLSVIQDRHLAHFFMITGVHLLNPHNEPSVDLLDNLINTGKEPGKQLDRPFFKGFGHNRMVCIGTGLCGHFPRLIPGQVMLIHQHPHQFRDRHGRMRIIELESYLFMELPDIVMLPHILRHRFLYGCGDKEILLFQAELLAGIVVIVGIENLYDITGKILLFHSLLIITLVEGIKLEALHRLRIPDTQRVDNTIAVAHDRHIIGDRLYGLISLLAEVASALLIHMHIDITAEFYLLGIFGTS